MFALLNDARFSKEGGEGGEGPLIPSKKKKKA